MVTILNSRFFAVAIHLGLSLLLAAFAWLLVFKVFYPYPFNEISGGHKLFLLIAVVDIVLGPLLTFIVFSPLKAHHVLMRDLMTIVAVQVVALIYGLWTIYVARPVYLVHEIDRFKVVSAIDVDESDLDEAPIEFRRLSRVGIKIIGIRSARNGIEKLNSLELELAGKDLSLQPGWWQPISDENRVSMRRHGKSIALLRQRTVDGGVELDRILSVARLSDEDVIALPLVTRLASWSILIDKRDLKVVGYLPVDLF